MTDLPALRRTLRLLLLVGWFWLGVGLGLLAGTAWLGHGQAQSLEVTEAIQTAAATYGVSERCLWSITRRETGGTYWPWVTNRRSGAMGLFQYLPSTWRNLSRWAGYAGADPYDPYAAAMVAAWTIAHPWSGGLAHWQGC